MNAKKDLLLECIRLHLNTAWDACEAIWEFILSHIQHNFLRCPHTGSIAASITSIGKIASDVNRKLPGT